MGYHVEYSLKLRIRAKYIQAALNIFNYLHSDEMLEKYARGGLYQRDGCPIKEAYWYSFVVNPDKPYTSLEEAFKNWSIAGKNEKYYYEKETGDFIVSGKYSDLWGQQDFLLKMLAPVLTNMSVDVTGEDYMHYIWIIDNHEYRTAEWKGVDTHYNSDDSEIMNDSE